MARWHAEAVIVVGAGTCAWAARLLTARDEVAWQGAERWPSPERAATAALAALRQAARAHRVQITTICVTAGGWWPRTLPRVPTLPETTALAQTLVPPPPVRLEAVTPERAIAHGHEDYMVDLRRHTCTCPAFRYRRGPCKHLRAALAAG